MTNHLRKASLRILKTGIIIFSGVLIFCSLLIGILHLPFVQRKIADYISATLSQKTQTRFRVGGLRFGLGDELKLTDVFIEDQQGKTLVRSKTIKGDPYWTALLKKKIILEHVLVEDADVNLYRTNNGAFNYQFLINAFTDTTASSGEPWVFTIEESSLKNVRFTYIDEQQGIDLSAYSEDAWVLFETLGLKDLHMKIEGVEFLNTNVFLQRRTPVVIDTSTQSAQPTPFRITALNAKFENSTFEYKDLSAPQSMAINKTAFDFTHINAKDVNGIVDRFFYSQGRLIVVSVAKASLKEKSGLELKDLAGRIAINEENILVDVQKLITPYSYFDDTIRVSVPVDLTFEKIALNSRFENDTISVKDLAYFVSGIDKYNYLQSDKAVISGIVSGGISYFKGKDIEVKTANDFYYKGSFQGQDFTQLSEARINFVMDNLTVGKSILRKVFSAADTLVDTGVIARVIASGNIEGRLLEPVVKVNVRSHAGSVKAHGKISFDSSFSFAGYKGKLSANDVLLGKLLRKEVLGLVSFNGEFVTTSSEIKAYEINITELDYKGYKYGSIYSLGKYKDKELTAVLKSEDTAFKTDVKFRADLSTTFFKIVGDINYIDFAKTNFSKKYLSLSGKVDAEWSGLHPDSIEGKAVIANLVLASCDNTIQLDSVVALSSFDKDIHTISVESEDLQAALRGKYKIASLPDAALHLAHHYYTYIPHPKTVYHPEWLEFYVRGNEFRLIAELLGVQNIDSVDIQGSFNAPDHFTHITGTIGSLTIDTETLKDIRFLINADKDTLVVNSSASMISFTEDIFIIHPVINTSISNNNLEFDLHLFESGDPAFVNVYGKGSVSKDTLSLSLTSADIVVKGKEWIVDEDNYIIFAKDYLKINDLTFVKDNQSVVITTTLTRSYETLLGVVLNNVALDELTELAGAGVYGMSGSLNGEVVVSELFANPGVEADLTVDSLSVNSKLMGDLKLLAGKEVGADRIFIDADLIGVYNNAGLEGYYYINEPNELDFSLDLNSLDLYPLQPFVNKYLFLLKGDVAGNLKIAGTSEAPVISGSVVLTNNKVGINLTNTIYTISHQKILFTSSGIDLNHLVLIDTFQNKAELDGMIYHQGGKDFRLDLVFRTDRFQLLNTAYSPDQPFYGELMAEMNAKVKGPVDNIDIQLNLTTLKGTRFYIPIAPPVVTGGLPDYIKFVEIDGNVSSPGDTIHAVNPKAEWIDSLPPEETSTLWRYAVKGRLNVTSDAQMNVVLDPVNRDMITGKGKGDFKINFESTGDLDIYGTYVLESGEYQYSLLDLVTKNFRIEKGSSISWSGNPLDGRMNVTAHYETKASVYELVQEQGTILSGDAEQAARTRVPVDVLLYVRGELAAPRITFDINLPESEGTLADNLVSQRISQIRGNQTELNRQVVSLIAFNRFMSTGQGVTGISGGDVARTQVAESVSQLLNEQLGRLTEQYIKGIDLDVSFEALDPGYGAFAQKARVSASKRINDRITIRAGGNVNVGATSGTGHIAGDYYGYYRINKSGSLNFKFFRTGLQTIYTSTLYSMSGASISYRRDFNRWKSIFRKDWQEDNNSNEEEKNQSEE